MPDPNANPPANAKPTKERATGRRLARLIAGLIPGTRDIRQLAEFAGLYHETVRTTCKLLHAEGAVHISEFRKDRKGRATVICYKLGEGVDAKRKGALTSAQRQARLKVKKESQESRPRPVNVQKAIVNDQKRNPLSGWSVPVQSDPSLEREPGELERAGVPDAEPEHR